jgi:hypothetical protein
MSIRQHQRHKQHRSEHVYNENVCEHLTPEEACSAGVLTVPTRDRSSMSGIYTPPSLRQVHTIMGLASTNPVAGTGGDAHRVALTVLHRVGHSRPVGCTSGTRAAAQPKWIKYENKTRDGW